MIYLNNMKLIVGDGNGIFFIKYDKEFKDYEIIFHVNKNNNIDNIIKTYNNYFLSLENRDYICDINKKYFVYQTQEFIYIIYHKNFKEHLKINYGLINFPGNAINKITDEIIGVTSSRKYQIDFFNIETGDKLYKITDENHIFKGILRSRREKNYIEIVTLNEHLAYQRCYGFCSDYIYNNNKWEQFYNS